MSSLTPDPISIDISDSNAFEAISFPGHQNTMIHLQYLQKDQTPILRGTVSSEVSQNQNDIQEIGLITKYPIRLPYLGYYKIEIQAYANNNRSYLFLSQANNQSLKSKINLLETKQKTRNYLSETSQVYKFRLKIKYPEIQIGLLIGGDSIILANDQITLQTIKIYPENDPQALPIMPVPISINPKCDSTRSQEFVIKKVIHNVSELESVSESISAGEYVILRHQEGQDHLYIKNSQNPSLEYVCGIGLARPNLIGQGLIQNQPGKIIPVYPNRKEAMTGLSEKGPEGFYSAPTGEDYHWDSKNYGIEGDIYLYLDSKGYVRWLKKPPNEESKKNF
jgi:hypothetical protein